MKPIKLSSKFLRKVYLLVCILLVTQMSIAQTNSNTKRLSLPDIGASSDTSFSTKEAREYAKSLVRALRAYDMLVEDPLISAYFSDMGYRLASNSDRPEMEYTFVVIKNPVLNAFAAPGGVIALNTGLITAADSEAEVAGVLSHEVAHITQNHAARAIENQKKISIPVMVAIIGLALISGSPEIAQAGLLAGTSINAQSRINFTRQNEHEADRLGIRTMAASGYDPKGMSDFFAKVGKISRINGEGPPEFLRTHPLSTTRIAEAKNRAAGYVVDNPIDDLNFYLVRARLLAGNSKLPEQNIRHLKSILARTDLTKNQKSAAEYGLVISLKQQGNTKQARKLLKKLLDQDPDRVAYVLEATQLDIEDGNYKKAQAKLHTLYSRFPGNIVFSTYLIRSLLADGTRESAEKAIPIIREQLLVRENDPVIYDLYAQASSRADNPIKTTEAVAESNYLRGHLHQAVLKLRELSRNQNLDYYQHSRISARLAELEIELASSGERLRASKKS